MVVTFGPIEWSGLSYATTMLHTKGTTMGYYSAPDSGFRLFESATSPGWRRPQLAALGQLMAHWCLAESEPPLVSLPTGVGKTAVAMAAPHLLGSQRVLVVVPSTELRGQTAA